MQHTHDLFALLHIEARKIGTQKPQNMVIQSTWTRFCENLGDWMPDEAHTKNPEARSTSYIMKVQ